MLPRIETLTYDIQWSAQGVCISPVRQLVTLGMFDCTIEGATLTARPRNAIATEEEGRAELEPRLQNWAFEIEFEDWQPG